MSKAVVFFAEGTEECEALLVVDLLRRAKVDVTVASATGNRSITSSHKVHITADALAADILTLILSFCPAASPARRTLLPTRPSPIPAFPLQSPARR